MPRPTKEGLYKKSGRPHWYCRFYDANGALVRLSTNATDHDTALQVYNQHRIAANCKPADSQGITVNTVLDIYHNHRGYAVLGQHGYTQGKSAILKYYDHILWDKLAAPHGAKSLDEYIDYRIKTCHCKPGTVNREISILSAAANVAIKKGTAIINPCHKRKLPTTKHPYYWLTHDEAAALIEAAKPRERYKNSDHLHAYCIIALGTGMRMSEILKLTAADISLRHNTIRLPTSKSGEPHEIPMSDGVRAAIETRLDRAANLQTPHLFAERKTGKPIQTIIIPFKHAAQRAGIPITNRKIGQVGFRVHDTRHTVASWLVQDGAPLEAVQDLLNHSDLRTTQRYAHHAPDARRATVAKLPKL
jgi:integrase